VTAGIERFSHGPVTIARFGGRADQQMLTNGTATDRFQYGYDQDRNVLYKLNAGPGTNAPANSELYHGNSGANGYDNFNRLREFQRGTLNGTHDSITGTAATDEIWTLDPLGNWTNLRTIINGGTPSDRGETFNAKNQLTGVGGLTTPLYDNNGNMTRDENGRSITYDAWNREMKYNGSITETYAYDADNRRPSLTISLCTGTITDSFYSTDWQVLEEDNRICGGLTANSQYVWGQGYVDDLILRDDNSVSGNLGKTGSGLGKRLFAQQDANFNVTSIVDTGGAVSVRIEYDPYGTPTYLKNDWTAGGTLPGSWEPLFQGLRYDGASGKYDARNRELDPTLGTWMRPDPVGYVNGAELYGFALGNPLASTDPAGMRAQPSTQPATQATPDFSNLTGSPVEIRVVTPGEPTGDTGGAEYTVRFQIGPQELPSFNRPVDSTSGWIIQHVTISTRVWYCSGERKTPTANPNTSFWEAWQVARGIGFTDWAGQLYDKALDTFTTVDEGKGTTGIIEVRGRVAFFPSYSLHRPPWGHNSPYTNLPSILAAPGWNDNAGSVHDMTVTWDDCCGEHETTKVSTDP